MPDDAVWEDIRRAHLANKLPLSAIAERHGVSNQQIYRYAKLHGWPPRPSPIGRRQAAAPQPGPVPSGRSQAGKSDRKPSRVKPAAAKSAPASNVIVLARSAASTRALVKKARERLAEKLDNLRIQLTDGRRRKSSDSERESRDLLGIINGIAKTQDIEHELTRNTDAAAGRGRGAAAIDAADLTERAEALRRTLAERLAQRRKPQ